MRERWWEQSSFTIPGIVADRCEPLRTVEAMMMPLCSVVTVLHNHGEAKKVNKPTVDRYDNRRQGAP